MYLLDYSIDNLSLMALTISTGFVVDDAIVVIENITRYLEKGLHPIQAALKALRRSGSRFDHQHFPHRRLHSAAVDGGVVGRLFHEFAVTLSIAIVVSMVLSLTPLP